MFIIFCKYTSHNSNEVNRSFPVVSLPSLCSHCQIVCKLTSALPLTCFPGYDPYFLHKYCYVVMGWWGFLEASEDSSQTPVLVRNCYDTVHCIICVYMCLYIAPIVQPLMRLQASLMTPLTRHWTFPGFIDKGFDASSQFDPSLALSVLDFGLGACLLDPSLPSLRPLLLMTRPLLWSDGVTTKSWMHFAFQRPGLNNDHASVGLQLVLLMFYHCLARN